MSDENSLPSKGFIALCVVGVIVAVAIARNSQPPKKMLCHNPACAYYFIEVGGDHCPHCGHKNWTPD